MDWPTAFTIAIPSATGVIGVVAAVYKFISSRSDNESGTSPKSTASDSVALQIRDLWEWHNVRENGRPIWYFPMEIVEKQDEMIKKLHEVGFIMNEALRHAEKSIATQQKIIELLQHPDHEK